MAALSLVQNLLRSPDEVKAVLEATLVNNLDSSSSPSSTATPSTKDTQNKRVLAVVSHRDDWDLSEEGRSVWLHASGCPSDTDVRPHFYSYVLPHICSLFVCKYKSGPTGQPEGLDVHRVYPIYGEFSVAISQMRRGTIDLQNTSPRKSMLEQSGSGETLFTFKQAAL